MRLVHGVSVSMTQPTFCSTGAGTVTTITYLQNAGNLPQMVAVTESAFLTVSSTTIMEGTKEDVQCNNRGLCNSASGACACFTHWASSNGQGAVGSLGDCGARILVPVTCPSSCSGHGTCASLSCTCYEGFTGADCSQRSCPFGSAWFDEPWTTNHAHLPALCSNMGLCQPLTGLCTCRTGFTGAACERLACPANCNNAGSCFSNRDLARLGTLNGELIGVKEVQSLNCPLLSGSFTLQLRHASTAAIAYNADAATVSAALIALSTMGDVTVTYLGTTEACGAANVMLITFNYDLGPQPLLLATSGGSQFAASRLVQGSRPSYGAVEGGVGTWDADMLYGCYCDGMPDYTKTSPSGDTGYFTDYSCSARSCPFGHDLHAVYPFPTPTTQTITCSLSSGYFTVEFRSQVTAPIAATASSATLVAALNALSSIDTVTAPVAATVCSAGGTDTVITFTKTLGVLPLLKPAPTVYNAVSQFTVTQVAGGTTNQECSGRGICDRTKGVCKCFSGHLSGNGFGAVGALGDCGAESVLVP